MSITKENKKNLINEFAKNDKDTGSTSVQIAVLTERIKNLTEHFKTHNKDCLLYTSPSPRDDR